MCARFDGFAKEASISRSSNGKDDKKWHQLDMLSWLNFFAFDSIASLAFGSTFGMLEQGRDDADVDLVQPDGSIKTTNCNAIQIINERGEYAGTMGCVPPWMRPMVKKIPWFATRLTSVRKLSGIALSRVNYRLQNGSDRDDLLSKLQGAKDEKGEPMGKMELTAEAVSYYIDEAAEHDNSLTHTSILSTASSPNSSLARIRLPTLQLRSSTISSLIHNTSKSSKLNWTPLYPTR